MNKKKMVLFLVSLVFLVAMSFSVSAAVNNMTVSITDISKPDAFGTTNVTLLNFSDGIYYLKGTDNARFKGQNYSINLTLTSRDIAKNLTSINITLPPGLVYITGSNGTNSSVASNFSLIGTNILSWISEGILTPLVANGSSIITRFWFKVKANETTTFDGVQTINITGGFPGPDNISLSANLTNNISLDNTAPTIANVTIGTGTNTNASFLYVFLSEAVNGSGTVVVYNGFNITYAGRTINYTTANEYNDADGKSVINITIGNETGAIIISNLTQYNATPTVAYNTTAAVLIIDRAGNLLANTSTTAKDKVKPLMGSHVEYTHSTRQLVIQFSENVNCSAVNLSTLMVMANATPDTNQLTNLSAPAVSCTDPTNSTTITVSRGDQSIISRWNKDSVIANLTLNFTSGLVQDLTGANSIIGENLSIAIDEITRTITDFDVYIEDSTGPAVSDAIFNASSGNLTVTFNDLINCTLAGNVTGVNSQGGLSNTSFILSWNSDISNTDVTGFLVNMTYTNITRQEVVDRGAMNCTLNSDGTSLVTIALSNQVQRNISVWNAEQGKGVLYLFANSNGSDPVIDFAGNNLTNAQNTSGFSIRWINDTTPPTIIGFNVSNLTINARSNTITLNFSEEMNPDKAINMSFSYTPRTGSSIQVNTTSTSWTNRSLITATWTLINNSATDGTITSLSFAGFKDDYNNSLSITATSNSTSPIFFTIDTVGPKLLRAYLADNRTKDSSTNTYNLARLTALTAAGATRDLVESTLVLVFNENLTATSGITNQTFNLTVQGDGINLSLEGIARDTIDLWKLNLTLSSGTNLTIRGRYNSSLLGVGNSSGIDINNESLWDPGAILRDVAGNPALHNTSAVDIAEAMIEFTGNVSKTLSIPACADSTEIDRYLSTVTSACSPYTAGSWGNSVSSANFLPLRGYKCTLNGALDLPIYTKKASECGLPPPSVSLTQGWALVAVNQFTWSNATLYLSDLGSGSQVSYVYTGIVYTGIDTTQSAAKHQRTDSLGLNYGNLTLNPYDGYWIFTNFDQASKTFTGNGII